MFKIFIGRSANEDKSEEAGEGGQSLQAVMKKGRRGEEGRAVYDECKTAAEF